MKVRFITNDPSIDLTQLGHGLNDSFQNLPFKVNLSRNPIPCQATKVACLGWLFGSSKTISEKTFVPAVRKHLKIPKECSIGVQWRTITNQYGKRPPFNPDAKNAPPSALHVDIDDRFAPIFLSRASELWKKNNKGNKRLPNDIQLRLVPCFTQLQSKAMTPNQQNNVLAMAEKQHYLTMKVFTKFEIPFIKFLDMPLNSENPLTLRRTLMAKAPSGAPTRRLIHNVDPSWANPAITVISTTMNNLAEANEFTATIIPAALHLYGNDAAKWFTAEGISLFENISWDPTSEKAVSHSEADSAAMVAEDLWDIGEAWKSNDERQSERPIHGMNGTTKGPMERPNNAFDNDEDNRSFASLYGRQSDQTTATPLPPTTKKGGNVLLDSETLQQLDKKTEEDSPSKEDYSMSTMGKTTESTRLKLHIARQDLQGKDEEIARLQALLARATTSPEKTGNGTTTEAQPIPPAPPSPTPHAEMDMESISRSDTSVSLQIDPTLSPRSQYRRRRQLLGFETSSDSSSASKSDGTSSMETTGESDQADSANARSQEAAMDAPLVTPQVHHLPGSPTRANPTERVGQGD